MSNPNVGFYSTAQLNPYTTTIGSGGTFQSIMSYIYGASSYETTGTASYICPATTDYLYTGISLAFTPINSQNALISYDIFNNNTALSLNMYLSMDTTPPPSTGTPASGLTLIDSGTLPLSTYRSQTLLITGGTLYGGNNSGAVITLDLNTKYYLTWYIQPGISTDSVSIMILGMSIQSI